MVTVPAAAPAVLGRARIEPMPPFPARPAAASVGFVLQKRILCSSRDREARQPSRLEDSGPTTTRTPSPLAAKSGNFGTQVLETQTTVIILQQTCQKIKISVGKQLEKCSVFAKMGSYKPNRWSKANRRTSKIRGNLAAYQDTQQRRMNLPILPAVLRYGTKLWGGGNLQLIDWGRESSDKFYSLTEESDLGSADCSFSETDESEISETGNKSASGECTVRKARQRKSVKSRSGLQEGSESMASRNGRSLRWDYTGINLADTSTGGNQSSAKDKNGSDPGPAAGEIGATGRNYEIGTDVEILQSIYSSIKELQTETRIDSHRARVATKRLQGSVRKVAKSCKEIEAKLCSMEDRIVAVEDDMDTLKEQNATRDGQLTDVMWKLEDLENRQRRNNLRFLGIPEGLEGDNMQTYMVTLLRRAFPELGNQDWDNEVQRAHRFPLNTREGVSV
ncbi:hypothetical protein NDU88_006938 [Pleurodeles waltl]|uniref:Uncharacterized protein n=1 Tax=Pleurodeles waltl TaxID=8319 RepID=A0AAV7NTI8_PLEWA|nr:hypothetical protein NDU88_006938 [Pleurodeles waltl]